MSKYISLIFDNNKKGYLISKILTNNFINYTDFIITDELNNIMLAKNYDNYEELKLNFNIDDTTVHNEFTDFILNWASYLKTNKKNIHKNLKKYIYNDFNNKPQYVQMFYNFIIDYKEFEINYKVENLVKLIPELNRSIFNKILFTKNNDLILKPINNNNILKEAFKNILTDYKIKYDYSPSNGFFYINVDNLIKNELQNLNLKNISLNEINHKDIFDKSNLTKNISDVFIKYNKTKNNYEFMDLFESKNCYATQTKGTNNQCYTYILDCLLNFNADGFLNCNLDDNNFFDATTQEINSIHPIIALRTLEKFGFEKILAYDQTLNHNILLIEEFSTWFNRIVKNTSIPEKIRENIKKNKKFEIYMLNLVNYVNKNPAILNKDIDYKQKTLYQKKNIVNNETINMIQILDLVESNIKLILMEIKNYKKSNNNNINYLAQLYNNYLKPLYYDKIRDTHKNKNYKIEKAIKIPSSSLGLFNIFIGYVEDLRQQNIYIRPNEFEKIEEKLKKTVILEKEIFDILIMLFKYLQYIELFKNYKSEELTIEKIHYITNTYYNYIEKKLNDELEIIKLIKSI